MDIRDLTDKALSEVFEHYYNGKPDFGDFEPSEYAVYTIKDKPVNFASGKYLGKSYFISLSIITNGYEQELYDRTEQAFSDMGFTYCGGTDTSEAVGIYPVRTQYVQAYSVDLETN